MANLLKFKGTNAKTTYGIGGSPGFILLTLRRLYALTCLMLVAATVQPVRAQSPQFVPAFPLYCQGPLTTAPASSGGTATPFVWAASGAGAANPAPGQCAWADRPPRGTEIQAGGGNVICDFSHAMASLPAGQFLEIGVERDPLVGDCMHLSRHIGTVTPPFSAVPALPPFTRPSIANLTPTQVASLRHGIQVMMSRPETDPTSYRFQANIHGTTDSAVTPAETQGWNQCEHGSYYFLAWHRMYLYFFDRILRAAAGDPNLVLPYWDWTDPAQRTLPIPFRQPADPSNPLFIATPDRPAGLNDGTAQLGAGTIDFSVAFSDTAFDSPTGSGLSFGGQIAAPMQFNSPHGDLESQPHDVVHVALGGLMGDPDTAAQDPIFWLHHANIDRLWNRWLQQGGGRQDATDSAWLNTQFTFFDEVGHAVFLTGREIVDSVGQLNYRYEDDPPVAGSGQTHRHAAQTSGTPNVRTAGIHALGTATLATGKRIELAGSSVRLTIPLSSANLTRVRKIVGGANAFKVLLRFDDIQYEKSNGVYYEVYLDPPEGETLSIKTPGYVGNLSLFGLKSHALAGHPAPRNTSTFVEFNIAARLKPLIAHNPKALSVVLVPRGLFDASGEPLPVPTAANATLGSVRMVYR